MKFPNGVTAQPDDLLMELAITDHTGKAVGVATRIAKQDLIAYSEEFRRMVLDHAVNTLRIQFGLGGPSRSWNDEMSEALRKKSSGEIQAAEEADRAVLEEIRSKGGMAAG